MMPHAQKVSETGEKPEFSDILDQIAEAISEIMEAIPDHPAIAVFITSDGLEIHVSPSIYKRH